MIPNGANENNMKEDIKVRINLKSIAIPAGQSPDMMEFITDGVMSAYEKDGEMGWKLRYSDSELTGILNSEAELVCIDKSFAQMSRKGDFTQCITMENGKRRRCDYSNEYGRIMLGVHTKQIISTLSDEGGEVYLNYTLDAYGSLISENSVLVSVRPAGDGR